MSDEAIKHAVKNTLGEFAKKSFCDASISLLESLGYRSEKRLELKPNTPKTFLAQFEDGRKLNPDHALLDDWQTVDFLFQLTEDEIKSLGQGNFVFEGKGKYNNTVIESYLFFAIALKNSEYTRTQLSGITREINKLFRMPAMLLFRHGDTLTLSIINRRLHKRDESKDVLEKVTLIKDIRIADPHRAHIEILFDLSLAELHEQHHFTNWSELQAAWQKTLDSSELNKRFFQEIANWYFWANNHVKFPKPKDINDADAYKAQSLIRLITRLIFCWFVKEKGLLPDDLFNPVKLHALLKEGDKLATAKHTVYYKAILQNLFFATLNQEMGKRGFRRENQNFMAHTLYRYKEEFATPNTALDVFSSIPFLNGGLFECLDKTVGPKEKPEYIRIDGFSDRDDNPLAVPDFLFFGDEREVDLSAVYGETRFKRAKVRGLIHTFYRYKFTITENTPIEEEIALDPELAGKVFENLLAAYNPETSTTARKQTGSFFTPREIVNYMVDEALIAYLKGKLTADYADHADAENKKNPRPSASSAVEQKLRHLFAYNDEPHKFTAQEVDALIAGIDSLKSLDPAVGSGAFPMGILHKLVFILGKLDPRNEQWEKRQINRVKDAIKAAEKIEDAAIRERTLKDLEQQIANIEEAFERNELDYGRKLYLIENCIYGVDIQPIAVQIAKMRFFISLVVDQRIDRKADNLGIRPLPNLETKFVSANTLIGIEKPTQQMLRNPQIDAKEKYLKEVRNNHFSARTPSTKAKWRELDAKLRAEISELLKADGFPRDVTEKLANWNLYDQNASADFFDAEWMFGITEGFDISIGNPPYVRIQTLTQTDAGQAGWLKEHYASARKGNYDLYVVFVERGLQLLQPRGQLAFILPHKFFNAQYGEPLRKLLADGKNLRHVVHFGDQQIFPGATNYVCLLFLAKDGADHCRWVRVDDLLAWLADGVATETPIPSNRVTGTEWNFAVGKGAGLFEKLQRMPVKLGDVARIFQGLVTGADKIFALDEAGKPKAGLIPVLDHSGNEWRLEQKVLKPFLHDVSLASYQEPKANRWLLFPYSLQAGEAELITAQGFAAEFPEAWRYLKANGEGLRERENGKWRHDKWYAFGRSQNMTQMNGPKLIVQVIALSGRYAYDDLNAYFTGGGNGPYYGVRWLASDERRSLHYLQALLNSQLLDFFLKKISSPFRGGYWSYGKRFIEQLPIRPIDFAVASERVQHDAMVSLVERILAAKKKNPAADTSELEREIDRHVYALYGLTPAEIKIVEEATG